MLWCLWYVEVFTFQFFSSMFAAFACCLGVSHKRNIEFIWNIFFSLHTHARVKTFHGELMSFGAFKLCCWWLISHFTT